MKTVNETYLRTARCLTECDRPLIVQSLNCSLNLFSDSCFQESFFPTARKNFSGIFSPLEGRSENIPLSSPWFKGWVLPLLVQIHWCF